MKPTIRPAREEDTDFIAWVMQAASRSHRPIGVFDLAFPDDEPLRLDVLSRSARVPGDHFGHYKRFLIAEVDGQPASALSAYENSIHGEPRLTKAVADVFIELGKSVEELIAVGERMAPFDSINYPNPDGLFIIEWVATLPEYRGKGIMLALLEAILTRGRQEGYERAQIGYLLGNHPARAAYESVGFVKIDEWTSDIFEQTFGEPGVARMQMDL